MKTVIIEIMLGCRQICLKTNKLIQQPEITLEGVGHFCQEEAGPELAAIMNNFIAGRPIN